MKRNTPEFCNKCGDFYAQRAVTAVMFENFEGESFDVSDDHFYCDGCGTRVERHQSFIKSLELRSDDAYLTYIMNKYVGEVSESAILLLFKFLKHFTVPSYCVLVTIENDDVKPVLNELQGANLLQYGALSSGSTIVILNALELELNDRQDILDVCYYQASFRFPNRRKEKARQASAKRNRKIAAMVNDFTDEQREQVRYKFGNKCALTGKEVPLEFDHVIPVDWERGGTTVGNMLPIWQRINSSKSNRNIFEWYEQNGDRFEVKPELFRRAIEYLADLNGMTYEQYRDYVYECEREFKQTEVLR